MGGQPGTLMMGLSKITLWIGVASPATAVKIQQRFNELRARAEATSKYEELRQYIAQMGDSQSANTQQLRSKLQDLRDRLDALPVGARTRVQRSSGVVLAALVEAGERPRLGQQLVQRLLHDALALRVERAHRLVE